jgi:hypothetical protein
LFEDEEESYSSDEDGFESKGESIKIIVDKE